MGDYKNIVFRIQQSDCRYEITRTVTDCTVLGINSKSKPDKIPAWTKKVGTKAHPLLRCCWPVMAAEKRQSVFSKDVISDPRMETQIAFCEIEYKQANQKYGGEVLREVGEGGKWDQDTVHEILKKLI